MKRVDLTGKRFGRLTVLHEHPEPYRSPRGVPTRRWVCKCDCGKEIVVLQNCLTRKNPTQSCGCLQAEATRARARDVIGKRFGRLTVISECDLLQPDSNGNRRALVCRCDCGNEIVTTYKRLISGTRSCGCLLSDTARQKIADGVNGHVDGTNVLAIREGRPPNKNNTSGALGVYYSKRDDCWIAKIGVQGKSITLGRFATKELAIHARKAAEEQYFGPLREKHESSTHHTE